MPINYKNYPDNWKTYIRPRILARAGDRCEGSPTYPGCRAWNRYNHPKTGSIVILTVAHLDHNIKNNDGMDRGGMLLPKAVSNLRAWCQLCHNTYDGKYRSENAKKSFKNEIENSIRH